MKKNLNIYILLLLWIFTLSIIVSIFFIINRPYKKLDNYCLEHLDGKSCQICRDNFLTDIVKYNVLFRNKNGRYPTWQEITEYFELNGIKKTIIYEK